MSRATENKSTKGESPERGLPKTFYNNFAFEFFNAIFWQSLGTPLLLFIRQSGGSATIIGFTSALPLILMPLTIAASPLVERLGYRKVAFSCWTARWMVCSTLIVLALIPDPTFDGWRVGLALFILVLYHLTRNFGVSAFNPWITAIVPMRLRGLYLGRVSLFANLSSVLTYLSVGLILGNNPTLGSYAVVFTIAIIGGLVSSIFMSRITPPPRKTVFSASSNVPKRNFWQSVKRCFAQSGFKTFVIIQTFYGIAFFGVPSLSLIFMREKLGISPSFIMYFTMAGIIVTALVANVWGSWIDRYQSTMPVQTVAFGGLCVNSLLWLTLSELPPVLAIITNIMVMCLSATWISALNLSQTHSIMALAPEDDRVMFQNVALFITYGSQALAPTIWGFILDWLQKFNLPIGFYDVGNYQVFYFSSFLIGLIGFSFLFRIWLKEKKFRPKDN